jgi:type IV secretory pathway VirB3-like protein
MLVLLEGVILGIAFTSSVIDTSRIQVVLVIAGSVLVIFVLTHLFMWLKDSAEAKRINLDLEKYQKVHE